MDPRDLETQLAAVHPHAFLWAVRCCDGNRVEGEDVLHHAYVKVLDGRARFEGRSTFKTWIFAVIRRTAQEYSRRQWSERIGLGWWWRDRTNDKGWVDRTDELASEETGNHLRVALGQLSKRQQMILHLVFYQDLTIQEAAEAAGLSLGTARTHYERGKARLRRLLAARNLIE
jgi:RNA polymerase sigma factor (sigma-70 family)